MRTLFSPLALAALLVAGMASASPAAAQNAVTLSAPGPHMIVEPDAETIALQGTVRPDAAARCCVLRLSYLYMVYEGERPGRHWTPLLEEALTPGDVDAGVALPVDAMIEAALALSDGADAATVQINRDYLTGDKVTRWQFDLLSTDTGVVLTKQSFGVRGRPGIAASDQAESGPQGQGAPRGVASSGASSSGSMSGARAAAAAAKPAGKPAEKPAEKPAGTQPSAGHRDLVQVKPPIARKVRPTIPAPIAAPTGEIVLLSPVIKSNTEIHANTFFLQATVSNAEIASRCCIVDLYHYAMVNQPGGGVSSEWIRHGHTLIPAHKMAQGFDYDWLEAWHTAYAKYHDNPKYKSEFKKFLAWQPGIWRLELHAIAYVPDPKPVEKVFVLQPQFTRYD